MKATSQIVRRTSRGRITIPVKHLRAIGADPATPVRIYRRGNAKFVALEKGKTAPRQVDEKKVFFNTVDSYGNVMVPMTPLDDLDFDCEHFSVNVNTSKKRIEIRAED